jgi:hypothetical protein
VSPVAIAALVGAALGVVAWGAGAGGLYVALGPFLGVWFWLFWRALRTSMRVRWLAVPGFVVLAAVLFFVQQPALLRADLFRRDGVTTQAAVMGRFADPGTLVDRGTVPGQGKYVGYRYRVGAREYEGRSVAPIGAEHLKVGDTITIQYLRTDPGVSAAAPPTDTLGDVVSLSLLGAGWLVSGAVNLHVYGRRPFMSLWRGDR